MRPRFAGVAIQTLKNDPPLAVGQLQSFSPPTELVDSGDCLIRTRSVVAALLGLLCGSVVEQVRSLFMKS
jgi:hypothetical protein